MAEFTHRIENTNFTLYQEMDVTDENRYLYNYDRLRYRGDHTEGKLFFTFIGDAVNFYGKEFIDSEQFSYIERLHADVPFKTQSSFYSYNGGSAYVKLYRAYGGYQDEDNRIVAGLQNISMGVGRIWTPSDIFNPKNIYALEPDEVFGVWGVSYTRHISGMSDITAVISQKEDHSLKYALRYKAFLDFTDLALSYVKSDETTMIGYELEANLGDTGIEVRSEGAYMVNMLRTASFSKEEERFFQAIIGADYGFQNGITLGVEARYSSKRFEQEQILLNIDSEIFSNLSPSKLHTGVSINYDFNLVLSGALLYIESFDTHHSRFVAPALTYVLDDYHSFMLGAMINQGSKKSEFGAQSNRYYFNYKISF
jgi:hypothetical protein